MSVSAFQLATIKMVAGTFLLPASTHAKLFSIFYPDGSDRAKLDDGSYALLCNVIAQQWAEKPLTYPKGYETPELFEHFVKVLHCAVEGNAFCRVLKTSYGTVQVNVVGMVGLIEPFVAVPRAAIFWDSKKHVWICEIQGEGEPEVAEYPTFGVAYLRAINHANSIKSTNRYWSVNRERIINRLTSQYRDFDAPISMAVRIDSARDLFTELKGRVFAAIKQHEESYFSTR